MSFFSKRFVVSATVVALLAVGGGAAVINHDAGAETNAVTNTPPPVTVDVSTVINRQITDWQEYSGRLEAIERVDIRPQVSGTLIGVHFKDGALVKKGDLLFSIDPRPYAAEVEQAKAQLAATNARVTYTAANLARNQRLMAENAISRHDVEEAQNAAQEANASKLAAKAALDAARLNLEYTRITAPVAGRVSRAEITTGNVVAAGGAAHVLTTLVSVSTLYASFDVDEQSFLRFINNQSIKAKANPVYLGLANETGFSRQGRVSSVDNTLNTSSGTIRVRAEFNNADGVLLPGLYARIRIGGGQAHPAILVNASAVGTDQDKRFVIVVNSNNQTAYREVKLGSQQDGLQVIASGLTAGDRIVVNGLQRIKPGDSVVPHLIPMPAVTTSNVSMPNVNLPSDSTKALNTAPVKVPTNSAHDNVEG